jgi:uracil phosphoribosyltransferase
MVKVIGDTNSIFNQFLLEMRSEVFQQDRMRFRLNLKRAGSILAYEISKDLEYSSSLVKTPLGELNMLTLKSNPIIISILRAGLPLHEGVLSVFDNSDNGFISAYRQHTREDEFIIKVEYLACPEIDNKTVILCDPMIATGQSMVKSYKALLEKGTPNRVFIASVIASDEGLEYVERHMPEAVIYVGAVDMELTAKSYIVPGLGDAGDLAFGIK